MKLSRNVLISLCAGNFVSSLASGVIIAVGVGDSSRQGVSVDPILSYLISSFLSFFVIMALRRKSFAANWMISTVGAGACLWLSNLANSSGSGIAWQYLCMSLCFAASFIPRAVRADAIVRNGRAFVGLEVFYSAGYLAGLLFVHLFLGLESLSVLRCTAAIFLFAACFDFFSQKGLAPGTVGSVEDNVIPGQAVWLNREARLGIGLFFCLTLGVQLAIQRLASITNLTYPLGAFEFGVTLAPLFCLLFPSLLFRISIGGRAAEVRFGNGFSGHLGFSIFGLGLIIVSGLLASSFGYFSFAFLFFSVGSFLYEMLALSILRWLGKYKRGVLIAFGMNGLLCSAFYALLMLAVRSSFGLIGVVSGSFFGGCILVSLASSSSWKKLRSIPDV